MVEIKYGIAGILVLLSAFGGQMYLTEQEYSSAYVCDVRNEYGFFSRISGTSYTAYPSDASTSGQVYCKNDSGIKGKWVKLDDYAKSKGLTREQFLESSTEINITENIIGEIIESKGCSETQRCYVCGNVCRRTN